MLKLFRSTLLIVLALGYFTSVSFSQQKDLDAETIRFGKIDVSDFALKPTGADSAAAAMVIFDVGIYHFAGTLDARLPGAFYVITRHVRYKIIKKQGFSYGNLELQASTATWNTGTQITALEGATYNLENGKIVVSQINKDGGSTQRQDKKFSIKKYALPNVREGSIVEFKYTTNVEVTLKLRPWYFQKDIPTIYSSFNLSVPQYYSCKMNLGGFEQVSGTTTMDLYNTFYRYDARNIPALKSERFITTMADYASKVNIELATARNFEDKQTDFTSTWPQIIKSVKKDPSFGGFISKDSFAKTLLPTILRGETNKDSIVAKIFDYVKNNIKWNKEYNLYTSNSNPKSIIEKKAGNSADINLLLLILLKEAKINAMPTLGSTRDNGAHPETAFLTAFNSVIVEVVIEDQHLLLDATDKNHALNLIAYNNLNHRGLWIDLDKETSKWISTEKEKMSSKVYSYHLSLDKFNKFRGKLYITSTDYEALKTKEQYRISTNQGEFLKAYISNKPGLSLTNYQIINLNNPNDPLSESMDIEIDNQIEGAESLSYFMPLLYERTKENPFLSEERKFPIDFAYPNEQVSRITIELPEGYKLEKAPTSEKFVLPNDEATFSFTFSQTGNMIGIISKISIRKAAFSPEQYLDLKAFFNNIVKKQAEQIVIKKS